MADLNRLYGQRVLCHQCGNQWNRAQGGLLCPSCDSEFTEVLERPSSLQPDRQLPAPDTPNPFHTHNPWAPDDEDATTYQWNSPAGNGTFSFTSRTFVSGGGNNGRNVDEDPTLQELVRNFEPILTHITGTLNTRNDAFQTQPGRGFFPFIGQPPFAQPPRGFRPFPAADQDGVLRPERRGQMLDPSLLNAQDMFGIIFGSLNPPRGGQQNHLMNFVRSMLHAESGHAGPASDFVVSDEEFQRVVRQLFEAEAHAPPPPVAEEAIDALPRKNVTVEMMGNDGKVDCSICMEELELGTEVTVLPCNHSFHHQCIKLWLVQHDTCPQCRKPTQDHSAPPSAQIQNDADHQVAGDRAQVASPQAPQPGEGSMYNPTTVPESPRVIRERRRQHFGDRNTEGNGDLNRSQSHGNGSAQSTSRPENGGSPSNSSNSGGALGWVRNHIPFGG